MRDFEGFKKNQTKHRTPKTMIGNDSSICLSSVFIPQHFPHNYLIMPRFTAKFERVTQTLNSWTVSGLCSMRTAIAASSWVLVYNQTQRPIMAGVVVWRFFEPCPPSHFKDLGVKQCSPLIYFLSLRSFLFLLISLTRGAVVISSNS